VRERFGGADVVSALERVCSEVGYPKSIRVDQGPEFVSKDLGLWAYARGVELDFSRPGKPTDNAFIESLNGKFRVECLSAHWFLNLPTRSENASVDAETTMTFVRTVRSATKRRQHWRNAHRQRARREREKAESSDPAWSEYGGKLMRCL